MKLLTTLLALLVLSITARAASTINSANAYSYGANLGWMNWKSSAADGVSIGEYICSGYIYGANVGWLSLGNGFPVNHIQYSNSNSTDYGVNYSIDPQLPGKAILRGYAYGSNIGWIQFEDVGNPRLRFSDGRLEGYAYSANCGWINLGDGTFAVQTDTVAPGIDTDADGMADAFEYQHLGGTGAMPDNDTDNDGISDLQEYLEGTSPISATSGLKITAFSTANGVSSPISWTSNLSRLYAVQISPEVDGSNWSDSGLGLIIPDVGAQTSRTVLGQAAAKRFYRVRAIRPLTP